MGLVVVEDAICAEPPSSVFLCYCSWPGQARHAAGRRTVGDVALLDLVQYLRPDGGVAFPVLVQVLGLELDDLGEAPAGVEVRRRGLCGLRHGDGACLWVDGSISRCYAPPVARDCPCAYRSCQSLDPSKTERDSAAIAWLYRLPGYWGSDSAVLPPRGIGGQYSEIAARPRTRSKQTRLRHSSIHSIHSSSSWWACLSLRECPHKPPSFGRSPY